MDIILIAGFWLDASSWDAVTPPLVAAGHRVHPLTLPGLESVDADRSGIGLRDHVDAAVAAIDSIDGPVVLVGHSGGGAIAHASADARPDRVTRVVYVDSGPLAAGAAINQFEGEGPDVPLPDWSVFDDADLVDLDDELRAGFRARSIPQPRRVTSDLQELHDERRFDIPVTVITCEFTTEELHGWIEQGSPQVSELAKIRDVEYVELPTGHWPQFTRPAELGTAILAAVDRD